MSRVPGIARALAANLTLVPNMVRNFKISRVLNATVTFVAAHVADYIPGGGKVTTPVSLDATVTFIAAHTKLTPKAGQPSPPR